MPHRKQLLLFFQFFEKIHFVKDPFMVPYILGQRLGYKVSILYPRLPQNKDLPSEYSGVSLLPISVNLAGATTTLEEKYSNVIDYVYDHSKEIDILMLFFGDSISEPIAKSYKRGNKKGKIYVKLDMDPYNVRGLGMLPYWKRPFSWIKQTWKRRDFINCVDVASCETSLAYRKIQSGIIPYHNYGEKLVVVPNGIDEREIEQMGFGKSLYSQKENIMITVGRLGTHQKNTETLLQALANVNLKDWKFYMVGTIEKEFIPYLEEFQKLHPELNNKIIWTGPITNRSELYKLFNKSKVFVLSSRHEGFALVFTEAQRFSNYIITTPVGAAVDVVMDGKYGQIVPIDDDKSLAESIQGVVNGTTDIDVYADYDISQLSWEYRIEPVARILEQ